MDVATEGGGMAELRAAIRTEVGGLFAEMHRFVDRRIAELSAEVHGVTQLMDYSEANVTGQLSRVHEQIVGLLAAPAAATRNSGLELEFGRAGDRAGRQPDHGGRRGDRRLARVRQSRRRIGARGGRAD